MMRLKQFGPLTILCLFATGLLAAGVLLHSPQPASRAGEELKAAPAPRQDAKPLWAGLSVNRPVFQEDDTGELQINFTLVNDTDKVVNPRATASKILVNGKALADSAFILGNGPRDARFEALPSGDHLLFGAGLGKYFERPGVYRVRWEGESFSSAEVVFRVLPRPAKPEGPGQAGREGQGGVKPKQADKDLKQARTALEAILALAKQDKHLKPREGQTVRVEEEGAEVSLYYETPDNWPDMPTKGPRPRAGHGSVQVRVIRGPAKTALDAPFLPPARCCYALSVYGTSVAGVNVKLWSMTSDRAAHGRLEAIVRARLKAAGIEMNARPLEAPLRAGMESDGPPTEDAPVRGPGQP